MTTALNQELADRAHVVLMLAVLNQAKEDEMELRRKGKRGCIPMWRRFKKSKLALHRNQNALDVAMWVIEDIMRFGAGWYITEARERKRKKMVKKWKLKKKPYLKNYSG